MCGIFGYSGKKVNAGEIVLEGLKTLEYRGYDSWGIAVSSYGNAIEFDKRIGKISDASIDLPKASIGIGHTRWATHGGVTVRNAHPHLDMDKKIALLHNGIIENYEKIRGEFSREDYFFQSETDTEVSIALLYKYIKSGKKFSDAFREMFKRLQGLNAIVAMSHEEKKIVVAKTGSPIVLGKSSDGFFVASDASGIIKHTRMMYFLKDNEMAEISDNGVKISSLINNKKININFDEIDWDVQSSDKGDYPHYMIKEIYEQPEIIRKLSTEYLDQIDDLAELINLSKGTFFVGAGTAYNACLAGSYLFSKISSKHVNASLASEFNYIEDFLNKKSLIIALSQSGETIDVVEPLSRAKQKGSKIAGIINSVGSTIYRMSNFRIILNAGPEKAVASTKAYTAKLAVLLLLSHAVSKKISYASDILLETSKEISRLLGDDIVKQLNDLTAFLVKKKHIFTVGRGVSYTSALEAALKIKEVSYIHTEGLAGGELKHGTIALIEKDTPCIVFAPEDEAFDAIISNAMEIKARGGRIIGISSKRAEVFDHWIEVKDVGLGSIIAQIIPVQILSYLLAIRKGLDPDKPRNLAKSVVVR